MKIFSNIKNASISYFLIFLIAVLFVPSATAAFRYLHEGMKLPSIDSKDILTDEQVSSEKIIKDNNMLIVVFWATWSKRSIEELHALKEIRLQYPDAPFKIIAVNVESQIMSAELRQEVINYSQELDLPFPVIIDNKLEIFYQFGVIAVPSTAITDTIGVMRYGPAGFSLTTHDLIIDSIDVILGKKDIADTTLVLKKGYLPNLKSSRYYNLALNLKNKRMYERALANVEISIQNDSLFPVPYSLKGELYIALQEDDKALVNYKKAVELDSTFVAAWSGLGELYLKMGQIDSAVISLNRALALDEFFTPAMMNLALCYSKQGNNDKALELLKTVLEFNQHEPYPYYYLALISLNNSDKALAVQSFKDALEMLYPAP